MSGFLAWLRLVTLGRKKERRWIAKWDQFETRPSLFFLALSLPPDGKACQWPGIKLPLHKLIVIRTSVRLPPQTLNGDQALLLVKPVANGPWKRKGNSRSVLGFKHSLWPYACFHTWITLQVVFSGLHRFHNAMVRPFWQTESNECEWMDPCHCHRPPSLASRKGGPNSFPGVYQRSAPIYTKWVLDIRGWHLYLQDGS